MIFGKIETTPHAVETHKDSYRIEHLTVVSVRRPFLSFAMIFAIGGTAFGVRFHDLLYLSELQWLAGCVVLLVLLGFRLGHLQLLSRDLRGSELTGAVWGSYGHLNRVRREIMAVMQTHDAGARP